MNLTKITLKMKINFINLLIVFLLFSVKTFSQYEKITVFQSGTEGHKIYRIPAIIKAPNGDLLAFAEGRVNGGSDFGDINIVMKRSADNGKTWSNLETIIDYANLQAGNQAPVVDFTDPKFPNGRIFLFYNTGNNHENEVRKGNGIREVWFVTSTDNGKTWSEATNITTQVHRPKQPAVNSEYNFQEDWRSYANTPGHALQISKGKFSGRIYVPANHSEGDPKKDFSDYFAHGFYTDDHGKTFHLSDKVSIEGSNESTAAEISKNRILLNARNQKGDKRFRINAISDNSGRNWVNISFDENLPDPVCEGSILNIGEVKGKQILAFSNAADKEKRDNLTIRISFDEGKTWKISHTIEKNPNDEKMDFAAYSDLVKIDDSTVGILYERNNYSEIIFTTYRWK